MKIMRFQFLGKLTFKLQTLKLKNNLPHIHVMFCIELKCNESCTKELMNLNGRHAETS